MSALCRKQTHAVQQKFLIRLVHRRATSIKPDRQPKRFGSREIDNKLKLGRGLTRKLAWAFAAKNAIDIACRSPIEIGEVNAIRSQAALFRHEAIWVYGGNTMRCDCI